MIDGRHSFEILEQNLGLVRNKLSSVHQRMTQLGQKLEDLRQQLSDQYRELAGVRLNELEAQRIIGDLDSTDRTVLKLLAQKRAAVEALEREITAIRDRLEPLNRQRDDLGQDRDRLLTQIDEQMDEIEAELVQTDAFQKGEKALEVTLSQAEKAQAKAEQVLADRNEKGKPYESDPLFMYLWRRRFETPDYTGGFLTKSLDRWVARMVHYDENRANYHMLTQLPEHLQAHAQGIQEKAENLEQELEEIRLAAFQKGGIGTVQSELDRLDKKIEELEKKIERDEKEYQKLMDEHAEYAADKDSYSQEAIDLQTAQLKRKDILDLYHEARMTATPKDDVMVSRISTLNEEKEQLEKELAGLKTEQGRRRNDYSKLEDLRGWYRNRNYDSQRVQFPSGFDLTVLLGELLRGTLSSGGIRDRIGSSSQYRRRRGSFGGGIGGGLGGHLGSRGRSSRGGSRGGGFRTGGGF